MFLVSITADYYLAASIHVCLDMQCDIRKTHVVAGRQFVKAQKSHSTQRGPDD